MLVASILWGREKYEYESTILGIYQHTSDAVQAIATALGNKQFIMDDDKMSARLEHDDDDETNESDSPDEKIRAKRRSLINAIKNTEDLTQLCYEFGDSYQGEGWDWKLENIPIFGQLPK